MEIMLSPPVTVIRLTKALTLSWPQYVGTTLLVTVFSCRRSGTQPPKTWEEKRSLRSQSEVLPLSISTVPEPCLIPTRGPQTVALEVQL